jgi:hypothetical protein
LRFKSISNKLLIATFILSAIWASTGVLIERAVGDRSLPALLCAMVGAPGLFIAAEVNIWTSVHSVAFTWMVAMFGNWLFYFGLLWAVAVIVHKARARSATPGKYDHRHFTS